MLILCIAIVVVTFTLLWVVSDGIDHEHWPHD